MDREPGHQVRQSAAAQGRRAGVRPLVFPFPGVAPTLFPARALTAYYLLLSTFCLLPSAYCLLPSAAPGAQASSPASPIILQGFELLGQHDAVTAEKAFRQAIELQPEAEAAHRGLGLALREEDRLLDAFHELQTATQLDPSDADAHYTLGSVAWALSMPANAQASRRGLTPSDYQDLAGAEFAKALALSPRDPMLRISLAMLYLDSNRPNDAIHQAEEAVRIAPDNAEAHVTLGRSYFAAGEEEKAGSEYAAAIKLDPQDGGAYLALGQMRLFQRRTPAAEEALRHAIQVSPHLGPAYAALAQVLMGQGKNAEARGVLENAVKFNAQDWQSQYELAVLLNQAGESARATELLNKVLEANPDFREHANNWRPASCAEVTFKAPRCWRGKWWPRTHREQRGTASWRWPYGSSATMKVRSRNAPWP